jgi:hypothetical protein
MRLSPGAIRRRPSFVFVWTKGGSMRIRVWLPGALLALALLVLAVGCGGGGGY